MNDILTPTRVLIADDEPDILAFMAKKLAQAGFLVSTAVNGEEAWEKIGTDNPDVILLDLNMPIMDGWTVLKKLRENPPTKKWQPVIIVSTAGELDNIQKGLSLEADHYITKPCKMEDIIRSIRLMVSLIPHRKTNQEE